MQLTMLVNQSSLFGYYAILMGN